MLTIPSFLWLPETKQRTLEELDYVFAVPTRTHMRYQVSQNLPWWFKTYVLRQKGLSKPVLYKLTNHHQNVSVTHQMSYAWNTYILRKKGLTPPDAYVRHQAEGEKTV
jgi:hypothetical protein